MFYISEVKNTMPSEFVTPLQKKVYQTLDELNLSYERVHTDEAITMDDCTSIDNKLNMKMVKTLFLCNQKKTLFYLFVTTGDKKFKSKDFSHALDVSRVSFAPKELMNQMLGTKIGAATIYSSLLDENNDLKIVIDKDVINEKWYGCSDGTTTGYMKIKTDDILNKLLPKTHHIPAIIEV
ncbi:prolyl-tRNA synthetase associated domain-containing protein [Companilactobacillus baiquanensis]|uniref:Prolyl-tRNA synthetase associated domain-containing protein n=1 Tax=Companilactobacillus baiquanensis TaxID=2486005 RepID=A0ABW1UVC3_9LACO|nr:YbaK/EbsC family protein [Companilactobacillus baiquanensis]